MEERQGRQQVEYSRSGWRNGGYNDDWRNGGGAWGNGGGGFVNW